MILNKIFNSQAIFAVIKLIFIATLMRAYSFFVLMTSYHLYIIFEFKVGYTETPIVYR